MTSKSQSVLKIRLPVWRARLLVTLMFLGFMALAARAILVQFVYKDFLQAEAEKRYSSKAELVATRGMITDRNGKPLATSPAVKTVTVNPTYYKKVLAELEESQSEQLSGLPGKLVRLSDLLDIDLNTIERRLAQKRQEVTLKRQIDPRLAKEVMSLNIPGVSFKTEYKRFYPSVEATAHLIGFTGIDHKGLEGLEFSYQKVLAGKPGSRQVNRDRKNQIIETVATISEVEDGEELALSIDRELQHVAFSALENTAIEHAAKSASIVVLDVRTGEVLALANWPSYNPNNRSTYTPELYRNGAIVNQFEFGSTLKPFTIAAALEGKFVTPKTLIDIEDGRLRIGGRTISDDHPEDDSLLSVTQVIQRSSNVGTIKIAKRMPSLDLWTVLSNAGFGKKPTLRFPGVASGKLTAPEKWTEVKHASISFGYGISASLLQLARAYTIFARDGVLIPLTLERRTEVAEGEQVVSKHTARKVLKMLETVTHENGTGIGAAIPGYRVAGKTGTAKVAFGGSYARGKYRSSFVGIAPVSNPRFIVAVMVDEPSSGSYYASTVAAPVFRKVMEETLTRLGVDPDNLIIEREAKREILPGPV